MNRLLINNLIIFLIASISIGGSVAIGDEVVPEKWLADAVCDISDVDQFQSTLAALQSTNDKELTRLFSVLSNHPDKKVRLVAVIALGNFDNPSSTQALKRRIENDPIMAIQAESLVHLLDRDQADILLLKKLLSCEDENIQCIAARAICRKTQDAEPAAINILKKLVNSKDSITSALAQTSLLAAGHGEYYAPLEKIVLDKKTETSLVRLVLRQIAEEKVTSAASLAIHILNSERSLVIRVLAARAIANATPDNPRPLFDAIRKSSNMIFRISVLRELADCNNPATYLKAISKSSLPVGRVAEFELARKSNFTDPASLEIIEKAMMLSHPVAVNHILARARKDVENDPAKSHPYVPAFIKFINSVDAYSKQMTPQHILAAQTATLLVEISSEESIQAIRQFLNERYSARLRAVSAGLIRCKNKNAALLAKPMIDYPYLEISSNAALTLGHFADRTAENYFIDIMKNKDSNPRELVTLACWYLLKINNTHQQTLDTIMTRLEQN